jgi:hypothetical protein
MGDRFDAALPILASMANRDGPKYLMFEVLAERTLAVAQQLKRGNPDAGYSPYLDHYIRPVLAEAKRLGVKIISNMGAANPIGAAKRIREIASELGIHNLKITSVVGDDLTAVMINDEILSTPTMEGIGFDGRPVVAANVYLGARGIADALATGADIVLVGRTTDSALALGPLIHEYGWSEDDWDRLAAGTICGHLLECGGQVSGTYFADPGFKDVPDLARAGFPIAEVEEDGSMIITKPENTGGLVSRATVIEQLLYEMHDPAAYLVADCISDITQITLTESGPDRVHISGVKGHPAPQTLKATVCVDNGWMAEAEMTYAGPNALARAELAGEVVRQRLGILGMNEPARIDIIGTNSVLDGGNTERRRARTLSTDGEYRLRVASMASERTTAQMVADEVQSLYCSGPAAGGGYRCHVTPQIATASILIPRDRIEPHVEIVQC